jgi:hypothetical protein
MLTSNLNTFQLLTAGYITIVVRDVATKRAMDTMTCNKYPGNNFYTKFNFIRAIKLIYLGNHP